MNKSREFGELLVRRKYELGKTYDQIAREMGVNNRSVNQWETGTCFPEPCRLSQMSVTYWVDFEQLTKIFQSSLEAKRKFDSTFKKVRWNKSEKEQKTEAQFFPGGIRSSRTIMRMNHRYAGKRG